MRANLGLYVAVTLGLAIGIAIVLWWLPTIILNPSSHGSHRS